MASKCAWQLMIALLPDGGWGRQKRSFHFLPLLRRFGVWEWFVVSRYRQYIKVIISGPYDNKKVRSPYNWSSLLWLSLRWRTNKKNCDWFKYFTDLIKAMSGKVRWVMNCCGWETKAYHRPEKGREGKIIFELKSSVVSTIVFSSHFSHFPTVECITQGFSFLPLAS